ncbi:PDF receptor-like [Penaeus vannamei]|uniref:PDF receptor-like n=1 Tax=Penaeus vannamei TaxID=6689 RepID=UPI00387F7229
MDGWCNATWDRILCWPPTPAGTVSRLPCPPLKGVDPSQVAERRCTAAAHWEGRTLKEGLEGGWTNYTPCLIPEIRVLMDKLFAKSKEDAQTNFLFLLNILRVLITKLQASVSSEAQQVKKAVRAAIVLLPLLGITNSLQMIHSPLEGNIVEFAAWSFGTTFLTAFQGFFVALLYCFLNNEVRSTIGKCLSNLYTQRLLPKRSKRNISNGAALR